MVGRAYSFDSEAPDLPCTLVDALIVAKEDGSWPAAVVERLDGLIDRAGGFSGEAVGLLDRLYEAAKETP